MRNLILPRALLLTVLIVWEVIFLSIVMSRWVALSVRHNFSLESLMSGWGILLLRGKRIVWDLSALT